LSTLVLAAVPVAAEIGASVAMPVAVPIAPDTGQRELVIDLRHEAHVGAEVAADVLVAGVTVPVAGVVVVGEPVGVILPRSGRLAELRDDASGIRGPRAQELAAENVGVVHPVAAVEPRDVVPVVAAAAAGEEDTHGRGLPEVPPVAQDGVVRLRVEGGCRRAVAPRKEQIGAVVAGGEDADGVLPFLAGQLDAPGGVGHVAAEDRVERRAEEVGALEEEGPLFWKE